MTGRPTLYTPQNAERILTELARGRALRAVCRDQGMPPYSAVRQWIADDRDGFAARYRATRHIDKAGAPRRYSAAIADRILRKLMNDKALDAICRDPDMPGASTVRQWVKDDHHGFAARYRDARRIGRARPGPATTYSAGLAGSILAEIAGGRPLTHVCRDPGMPSPTTVRHWARQDHDGFAASLDDARSFCLDVVAAKLIDIVDHPREEWRVLRMPDGSMDIVPVRESVKHTELRASVLLRLIAKMAPG